MEQSVEIRPDFLGAELKRERLVTEVEKVLFDASENPAHIGHRCSLVIEDHLGHQVNEPINRHDLIDAHAAGWTDNHLTQGEDTARGMVKKYEATFGQNGGLPAFVASSPEVTIVHRD